MMRKPFPVLESDRLHLRRFNDNDLSNVFKGLSHPEIIKYYGVSYDSLEATKEQLRWFENLEENENGIWWAISSKKDDSFLGAGGLNELSQEHRKAEIGFWLLPEYWGQGIMKEGMDLILKYAFEVLNLHRIEGFVESENENCRRGLAKLNFIHEGRMRDCEVKKGALISLDIYSKIRTDLTF